MVPLVPVAPLPTSWPAKTAGLVVLVQQVLAAVVRILSVGILDALCRGAGGQMEFLGTGVQDVGGRCGNRRAGLPSGRLLPCPMVVEQPDGTFLLVSYEFCKSCTYCCDDEHPRYIRCGYALPVPVNQEMSRKLYLNVIVNENKVMFTSESQKYWNNFLRCLSLYIRPCFRDPR